jgi:hypothetical protein
VMLIDDPIPISDFPILQNFASVSSVLGIILYLLVMHTKKKNSDTKTSILSCSCCPCKGGCGLAMHIDDPIPKSDFPILQTFASVSSVLGIILYVFEMYPKKEFQYPKCQSLAVAAVLVREGVAWQCTSMIQFLRAISRYCKPLQVCHRY